MVQKRKEIQSKVGGMVKAIFGFILNVRINAGRRICLLWRVRAWWFPGKRAGFARFDKQFVLLQHRFRGY